jgi:hypothetical protein
MQTINTNLLHDTHCIKTGLQLVKKIPAFYTNRRFITPITRARHLSLSWARSVQSMPPPPPHPTSWRYILMLFSHLRLCLPSGVLYLKNLHPNRECTSAFSHSKEINEWSTCRFLCNNGVLLNCVINWEYSITKYWREYLELQDMMYHESGEICIRKTLKFCTFQQLSSVWLNRIIFNTHTTL